MMKIIVFLFLFIDTSSAAYKRWLPDTNFENPHNWNVGRAPCGNDRVLIPDDSPVVYMQMNTTLQELILPTNGEIILGNNVQLAFTQAPLDSAGCPEVGGDVEFTAIHPQQWVDPNNWCTTQTEYGDDCLPSMLLETEQVPCVNDDVVFQRYHTYYINLGSDLKLTVKTLKLMGKSFTTSTFAQFQNSSDGQKIFSVKSPSAAGTTITITRQGCNNNGRCPCRSENDQIISEICAVQARRCSRAACSLPIKPVGACCDMCGAVLNGKTGQGFNFDAFKNLLQQNFFNNNTDVQTAVSLTSPGNVQIVLQSETGSKSTKLAHIIKADIDADLKTGGHKYALNDINYVDSGTETADKMTDGQEGIPKLTIAAIIIGVLLLMTFVTIALLVWKCGRSRILQGIHLRRHLHLNLGRKREPPSGAATPPHTVGSLDPGFANPLYDSSPFEKNVPSEMELRSPKEEQPTFDAGDSASGFNNPLYGAGSFFADPAAIPETSIDVEASEAQNNA
ncbi:protein amnionless-like isoform X1 [Pomacea canaliculata]|uniref:protein amnionless-like isoform X1 n=1 Tax=Pomacea canaliculata TaxID=400727 RepID=UPI000D73F3BC|nr:protein amnionless-like isoform X1 [Pomacea canaliculata]